MASIRKREWTNSKGKQTAWEISYYVDSKQHKESGFKTKAEAERALTQRMNSVHTGQFIKEDKSLTFADLAEHFIKYHAEVRCKSATIKWYKQYISNHLLPFFSQKKVLAIKASDVNEFLAEKNKTDLHPNTINHCLVVLKAVFNYGVKSEIILKNPAINVSKLNYATKEMDFLNRDEAKALLATAKALYPDFYPLLFTAIFTGMREGELLALTWNDINWKKKKISITKSMSDGEITTPKTSYSIRKTDMTDALIGVLQEHKRNQNALSSLVFSNSVGKILSIQNIFNRRFYPCLKKAGLRKIRFHDLRHTYVSLLLAKNVPIKYIQNQVGHSSITTTMNTYGHLLPEVNQRAVAILDDIVKDFSFQEQKISI